MFRKIITTILCLTLALCLPVASLAATQTTLTVIPGSDVASTAMIKDLFDALSITCAGDLNEGVGSFSIGLGGEEAVNITARADETGLYVQNAVLGEQPVFVAWSDAVSYILENLQKSEVDLSAFSGVMESVGELIALFPADMDWSVFANAKTLPEFMEAYKQVFKNDAEMTALIDEWIARIKVTDGEFTSESHDPATQKWELSYTGADYAKMVDTAFFGKYIEAMLKLSAQTGKTDVPTADEMKAEIKKLFEQTEMVYDIAYLTADEGQTIVSGTIDCSMKGSFETTSSKTEDGQTVETTSTTETELHIPMAYDRLTTDGATSHIATMDMIVDDKTMMTMRLSKLANADGSKHVVLGMLAEQQEISFVYDSAKTDDTSVKTLAMYIRSGATSLLEPAASLSPLLTFRVESKPADMAAFDAIKAATPEGSTQILKLTAEELETFGQSLMTRAQQLLYTVLGMMPASVLEGLGGAAE